MNRRKKRMWICPSSSMITEGTLYVPAANLNIHQQVILNVEGGKPYSERP